MIAAALMAQTKGQQLFKSTLLCAKASSFSKSKALNKTGGHWINRHYGSLQLPWCTTVQQCGACAKEVPNQVFMCDNV